MLRWSSVTSNVIVISSSVIVILQIKVIMISSGVIVASASQRSSHGCWCLGSGWYGCVLGGGIGMMYAEVSEWFMGNNYQIAQTSRGGMASQISGDSSVC